MCSGDASPLRGGRKHAIFPSGTILSLQSMRLRHSQSAHRPSSPSSCFRSPSTRCSIPARTARRASATPTGRAPACCRPATADRDARLLVFTGRTGRWKGIFAVHSWVVFKPRERDRLEPLRRRRLGPAGAHQRLGAGRPLVRRHAARAGRRARRRQPQPLIPKVKAAIASTATIMRGDYRIWPGPNSNTFVATVLRAVPELAVTLPPNAVGKDFRAYSIRRADRQRHRRRGLAVGRARRQGRMGRGRRIELPRPGGGARSAPSGRRSCPGFGTDRRSTDRHRDCGVERGRQCSSSTAMTARIDRDARASRSARLAYRMRDTLPLLEQIPVPADPPRPARHAAGQPRLPLQPVLRALPCQCRARTAPRRWAATSSTSCSTFLRRAPRHDARHHRRRAGAEPALPPAGHGRARARRARDRPLQPDDPRSRRARKTWRSSWPREQVEIVASLPCYLEDNVDRQRGKGVFDELIRGAAALNALGYGRDGSGLMLNLVYNPQGPSLPPPQARAGSRLQARARRPLRHRVQPPLHAGQHADPALRLHAGLARASSTSTCDAAAAAHIATHNLDTVMCRNLISVDWRGYLYDCDFNQMLDLPLAHGGRRARASA